MGAVGRRRKDAGDTGTLELRVLEPSREGRVSQADTYMSQVARQRSPEKTMGRSPQGRRRELMTFEEAVEAAR